MQVPANKPIQTCRARETAPGNLQSLTAGIKTIPFRYRARSSHQKHPPRLHEWLKQRAAANRRSLNSEAIMVLESALKSGGPSATPPEFSPDPPEAALAALPPEIAARLRALRQLRESLAARNVDFEAWKKTVHDARR